MKLTDLTAAAKSKAPNCEIDIDKDGETIEVVFQNILLVDEATRIKMTEEAEKAYKGETVVKVKGKAVPAPRTAYLKEAEASKATLAAVVVDPAHIELLEEIFSADPKTRELNWIALGDHYIQETQLGEAGSSQTS